MRLSPQERALERRIRTAEGAGPLVTGGGVSTPWIAPTLLNTWTNYGGTLQTAGYCRDSSGFVHMRGLIKRATGGITNITQNFFLLPAIYRPQKEVTFAGVGNNNFVRLVVAVTGEVYCGAAAGATPEAFISLDGIVYDLRA